MSWENGVMETPDGDRGQDQSDSGSSLKSLLEGTNTELILLIASFVILSIVAVLIVFLIAGPKSSEPTAKKKTEQQKKDEASSGKGAIFTGIPGKFINTADPDTLRVISVKIDLVLEDVKQVTALENKVALEVDRAEIEDLLLTIFSDKLASELQKPEMKDKLRRELEYEIQKIFADSEPKINVKRVLFRKYIIQ